MPVLLRVSADEEAVIGVCGGPSGDADARLSKDVVDRQSHDVLWGKNLFQEFWCTFRILKGTPYPCFDCMDLMPLTVTKFELVVWLKHCHNGSPSIVHSECHSAVNHLHDHEILPSLDGEDDAGGIPRWAK